MKRYEHLSGAEKKKSPELNSYGSFPKTKKKYKTRADDISGMAVLFLEKRFSSL